MSKSYAQLADEVLNGALTNPSKNPYHPTQGHQAGMPSMDPNDRLVEMNDAQRARFIQASTSVLTESVEEDYNDEHVTENQGSVDAAPQGISISQEDLEILSEAKAIIERIQEATCVGNIGVNLAGGTPQMNPKQVKTPGNKKPTKRATKKLARPKRTAKGSDFLAYLGGQK